MEITEITLHGICLTVHWNKDNGSITRVFVAEMDDALPLLTRPNILIEIYQAVIEQEIIDRDQLADMIEAPHFGAPAWHDAKARAAA